MDAQTKWLRKLARETDRARLQRARESVLTARQHRQSATRRAREVCAQARVRTREWVARARLELRAEIERLRAELRAAVDQRRAAVKECCGPDRRKARELGDERVAAARAQLDELRAARKTEAIWSRPERKLLGATVAGRHGGRKFHAEQRRRDEQENDSKMQSELSADEWTVYQAVRKTLKHRPRMSRLENFQHWMNENSQDVGRILADAAEKQYREALKREQSERSELKLSMKKARTPKEMRTYLREQLDAVPF